jgi:hypothetical protein
MLLAIYTHTYVYIYIMIFFNVLLEEKKISNLLFYSELVTIGYVYTLFKYIIIHFSSYCLIFSLQKYDYNFLKIKKNPVRNSRKANNHMKRNEMK